MKDLRQTMGSVVFDFAVEKNFAKITHARYSLNGRLPISAGDTMC